MKDGVNSVIGGGEHFLLESDICAEYINPPSPILLFAFFPHTTSFVFSTRVTKNKQVAGYGDLGCSCVRTTKAMGEGGLGAWTKTLVQTHPWGGRLGD